MLKLSGFLKKSNLEQYFLLLKKKEGKKEVGLGRTDVGKKESTGSGDRCGKKGKYSRWNEQHGSVMGALRRGTVMVGVVGTKLR